MVVDGVHLSAVARARGWRPSRPGLDYVTKTSGQIAGESHAGSVADLWCSARVADGCHAGGRHSGHRPAPTQTRRSLRAHAAGGRRPDAAAREGQGRRISHRPRIGRRPHRGNVGGQAWRARSRRRSQSGAHRGGSRQRQEGQRQRPRYLRAQEPVRDRHRQSGHRHHVPFAVGQSRPTTESSEGYVARHPHRLARLRHGRLDARLSRERDRPHGLSLDHSRARGGPLGNRGIAQIHRDTPAAVPGDRRHRRYRRQVGSVARRFAERRRDWFRHRHRRNAAPLPRHRQRRPDRRPAQRVACGAGELTAAQGGAWRTFQRFECAMPDEDRGASPRAGMSVLHGVAFIVGIVTGIGIFKSPQLVAQSVNSDAAFILLWVAGGVITLVGALVYAELGSAYPSGGGEYHFLSRALGRPVGLLFAWARVTVLQTGIISAVAFVFGDYAQQLLPLGPWGPAIHAAFALSILTLVNLLGLQEGRGFHLALTALTLSAIVAVVIAGLWLAPARPAAPPPDPAVGTYGLALVFVLLAYGGWSEAAYLSGDLRDVRRNMVRVLVIATVVITVIYVLMNFAYLNVLGLDGVRKSSAVGADAVRKVAGSHGAVALALVICCAALSALNGTIFTGARLYRAVGNDLPVLRRLGLDTSHGGNPTVAFAVQAAVAMSLIVFGAMTRDGFQAMVAYTAPVFWLFLLLVGVSYFILRRRDPGHERPFRAPLYPLTPILFCLTCAYLLYASLVYTGFGALLGVAMLLIGVPVVWVAMPRTSMERP